MGSLSNSVSSCSSFSICKGAWTTWTGTLSLSRSWKQLPDLELSLASTWKEYLLETSAETKEGSRGASYGKCAGAVSFVSHLMQPSST
jgi:hypothetical protein